MASFASKRPERHRSSTDFSTTLECIGWERMRVALGTAVVRIISLFWFQGILSSNFLFRLLHIIVQGLPVHDFVASSTLCVSQCLSLWDALEEYSAM